MRRLRLWLLARSPSTVVSADPGRKLVSPVGNERLDRSDPTVGVPLQGVEAVRAEDQRGVWPAGQSPGHVRAELPKSVEVRPAEPGRWSRPVMRVGFHHRVPVLVRCLDQRWADVFGEFDTVPVAVKVVLTVEQSNPDDVCVGGGICMVEERERDALRCAEQIHPELGVPGGGQMQAHVSSAPAGGR